ncbi:hypothetical protein L916_06421 [Phytophthora nicotianae]|uniref:Uncharacterized protein n=1 Tax=Phytophthora nicotianae TaxID=4792 RepID=W2J902_PHYNI|nr:hypothetical protein L916_06421 [Phytophthora nicotianae]
MTGLSASQLHPASLYAGDTIEYYSRCFVAGDARGLRSSVVLGIKEDVAAEYPISVDTGEMIPRDMMMKLTVDRFGNRFKPQYAVWRKLRTYTLIPGTCSAPTRASVFNVAISHAIRDAFGLLLMNFAAHVRESSKRPLMLWTGLRSMTWLVTTTLRCLALRQTPKRRLMTLGRMWMLKRSLWRARDSLKCMRRLQ